MSRNGLRPFLMAVCMLTVFSVAHAQKKFDKLLSKADAAYAAGQYDKATKYLNKFKAKVTAKLGKQNNYMPGYYIREANLNLVSGVLSSFEENLNNAISSASAVYGENSSTYAGILLDVAQAYNIYGYYRLSRENCDKAEDMLNRAGLMTDEISARLSLVKSEALTGQGFYTDAIALLKSKGDYFLARATDKETKVIDGKIQSTRLDDAEIAKRYSEYAAYQTLLANAYSKRGSLLSSDSAFKSAHDWIDRNLRLMGDHSLAFVLNNYLWRVELNDSNTPIGKDTKDCDYSNLLNDLKQKAAATNPLAQEIYILYLEELLEKNSRARYTAVKADYEKTLDKYFSKTSIVRLNIDAVEFDAKLSRDQTSTLESKALNLVNSPGLPRNYNTTANLYDFLYEVAITKQRYANAENYLHQILDIKKELDGETSPEYHLARLKLGEFYLDYTNKLTDASTIFHESYDLVVSKEIREWQKDHFNILLHMATLYEYNDKFDLASATLKKASDLAHSKYSVSDPEYAIALDDMAQLQIKMGQYEQADAAIITAIKILEAKDNRDKYTPAYVHALETQARLYGIKGMFDEAQSNLSRSGKVIKRADEAVGNELSTAEELSTLFIQLGKYRDTQYLLDKLIPVYEKTYGSSSFRLIDPLVNQGQIQLAKGDYTEAERTATRANDIAKSVYNPNSTKAAPTQRLLSDIYYAIGDYDKAEDFIEQAISSQEKQFGRNHIDVANSLAQLALIRFHKGDNRDQIEKLMLEARKIISDKLGNDNPQYAEIMKSLAVLYISQQKYDLAFSSLTKAETIWEAKTGSKNNINLASIYTLTGDVHYQRGNYPKAEEFYNRAKDLYEKFFSKTHPEYVKVLSKLSKVYYMEKDYKRSKKFIEEALLDYQDFIKNYFPALSEREKAKYWNTIKGDFEFYNTLAFSNLEDFRDLTSKVYDYQLLTKALLLNSSIKIRERILSSNDEELKTQYNLWLQQKESLTLALSMSPEQLAENQIDPVALQAGVEKLEKLLSEKSELFGQSFDNKKTTYEDVQKTLKPNEVAMEIVRYRYFDHVFTDSVIYAALYVMNDKSKPKAIILGDGSRMETRFFKYYRNAIISKVPDRYSYGVFWEPIVKKLGTVSTIYLSADGVYNQINLEAIPTPDGKYVIDNSNIVLVSNTKDLYLKKLKSTLGGTGTNTASMFGNPTFYLTASADKLVPALPGTEKEVDQVQNILQQKGWVTSEFVERKATEENIKELNSPKIFHIATHGFYQPSQATSLETEIEGDEATLAQNPLLHTGLLLSGAGDLLGKTDNNYNIENGILTAYEAMNLNLDKTDLVVLSACETGLGEIEAGEGVYGLQRAFLVAGAKVLIMSMFKVDDDATQKLMTRFYQKWTSTGNLRQSFVEAKKEIRNEYPDPIYWGAFMMIGLD